MALPLTAVLPDTRMGNLVVTLSQFPGTLLVFAVLAPLVLWRPVWMFAFRRRRPEWGLMGLGFAIQVGVALVAMLTYFLTGVIEVDHRTPDLGALLVMIPIALVGRPVRLVAPDRCRRGGRGVLPLASYFVTGPLFGWVSWHAGSIWFSLGDALREQRRPGRDPRQ